MINILNKRSNVQGTKPTIANLDFGEIGINTYDGKIFIKKDDGTQKIVEINAINDWILKSSNYTVENNDRIMADTSSSSFTLTLPSSVSIGHEITIVDYNGTWSTYNLIIDGNGHNILGSSSDLICDVDKTKISLIYTNPSDGWRVFVSTSNENNPTSDWQIKTSNYTASANDKIMADTSSSILTITLPLDPEVGFTVMLSDYSGTWFTNNLTVNGNGENIDGSSSNKSYDIDDAKVELIYKDSTTGWKSYIEADVIDAGYF